MKVTCNMVRDLILLYETDNVSDDSKQTIIEHISTCEKCKRYYEDLNTTDDILSKLKEDVKTDPITEKRLLKRGFSKIKKIWCVSILAVILLIPVIAYAARLSFNEINKEGLRYSNLSDVEICKEYFKNIQNGDFDKAAQMMDFSHLYPYTTTYPVKFNGTEEEFKKYKTAEIILEFSKYFTNGTILKEYSYNDAKQQSDSNNDYNVFDVTMQKTDGTEYDYEFVLKIVDNKITIIEHKYVYKGKEYYTFNEESKQWYEGITIKSGDTIYVNDYIPNTASDRDRGVFVSVLLTLPEVENSNQIISSLMETHFDPNEGQFMITYDENYSFVYTGKTVTFEFIEYERDYNLIGHPTRGVAIFDIH